MGIVIWASSLSSDWRAWPKDEVDWEVLLPQQGFFELLVSCHSEERSDEESRPCSGAGILHSASFFVGFRACSVQNDRSTKKQGPFLAQ